MSIAPEKFDEISWQYKYVTFNDESVLFCDAASICHSHKQLVDERQEQNPAVKPVSAGQIKIREKRWVLVDGGSTTAKLPRSEIDEDVIAKVLLPLGFVYDHDLIYG